MCALLGLSSLSAARYISLCSCATNKRHGGTHVHIDSCGNCVSVLYYSLVLNFLPICLFINGMSKVACMHVHGAAFSREARLRHTGW